MKPDTSKWIHTEGDRPVTQETDPGFWRLLKLGLLLALRERGLLNDVQLRLAREKLGGDL